MRRLAWILVPTIAACAWACSEDAETGPGAASTSQSSSAAASGTGGMTTVSSSTSGGSGPGGQGGQGGGAGDFPQTLGIGLWLVGWSGGGLDHFSWMRFSFFDQLSGSFDMIDAECGSCTPLYPCEGSGSFTADPLTRRLTLSLPVDCSDTSMLEFGAFAAPSGFFPAAILEAPVTEVGSANQLVAAQFGEVHCDPTFTMCPSPFE